VELFQMSGQQKHRFGWQSDCADSTRIAKYLDRYPDRPLIPTDPKQGAVLT